MMKLPHTIITMAVLLCAFIVPTASGEPSNENTVRLHDYVEWLRADLRSGKVRVITMVMKLDENEAKAFWPLYQQYEIELFGLGDHRLNLIREFVVLQKTNSLKDEQAATMAESWFMLETERIELLKKYHGVIEKELSPIRAAQFIQIEHRVSTLIDLMIASELPLIRYQTQEQEGKDASDN